MFAFLYLSARDTEIIASTSPLASWLIVTTGEISPLKINYMLIMKRGICYQNVFRQIDGVRSHERLHSTGKVPNGVK